MMGTLRKCLTIFALLAVAAIWAGLAAADEWPQWRGPGRDGVWREEGIVERFSDKQIKIRWRAAVGSGYNGPTVAGGRVFVMDRVTQPNELERVHAFDWQTGERLWTHEYEARYGEIGYPAGPRASVSIDGDRAYSLGTRGHLFCLDAATGKVLWSKDCETEYQIRMPGWGIAASPLVHEDLVIVQIGGQGACLVALDKKTGRERWRALDDRASYSAPIIIRQAERDVLVCWTGDNIVGLDPKSGSAHWKHPFKPARMVIGIATPVVEGNRLLVTSFYDGALMLRLDPERLAAAPIWRRLGPDEQNTDALHSIMCTPILDGDHVYGACSYGQLRCLKADSGDRVWENLTATANVRWGNIHMVRHGERVFLFNELGELIIARLAPDGFHEISRAQLIKPTRVQLSRREGVCWSHPAFAYKHVFARNDEELVAASLEKP